MAKIKSLKMCGNIVAGTKGFSDTLSKAARKSRKGEIVSFSHNDWPYLVADKNILETDLAKDKLRNRDKIATLEVEKKKYWIFGKKTTNTFILFDDLLPGIIMTG